MTISASSSASVRLLAAIVALARFAGALHEPDARSCPQIVAGRKTRVAEDMVEVPVGVDDDA